MLKGSLLLKQIISKAFLALIIEKSTNYLVFNDFSTLIFRSLWQQIFVINVDIFLERLHWYHFALKISYCWAEQFLKYLYVKKLEVTSKGNVFM